MTAELDPELERRMDELVEEAAAGLEESEPEPTLDISNEALLNKLRKKVYDNIEAYSPRDAMMVFIRVASLREAELKVEAKQKQAGSGIDDLVAKARRAIEHDRTSNPSD